MFLWAYAWNKFIDWLESKKIRNSLNFTFDIYCRGAGWEIASDTKHVPWISRTVRKYDFCDVQITAAVISIGPTNCRASQIFSKCGTKYVLALLCWKTTKHIVVSKYSGNFSQKEMTAILLLTITQLLLMLLYTIHKKLQAIYLMLYKRGI